MYYQIKKHIKGLTLTDMVFIRDGNRPSLFEGHIEFRNFVIFHHLSGCLQPYIGVFKTDYNFKKIESLYHFLHSIDTNHTIVDDKELLNLSYALENRVKDSK
eukprot:TRINITY_DN10160_c0_g1_i1.p1 TRINITY_DN10160_c0_g1~~TRINITY_DN10160_c0_g1_i1.p1  ORF type:complete len:102 (+),score=11.08 TRINITY_DN10160_c0_g1_i1:291-596(+)